MVPITDVLRQARNGVVADMLSEQLCDLIKKVDLVNKPGSLTLVIKVIPDKHGGVEKTLVFDSKVTAPRPEVPQARFFSTADGDLVRHDPTQRDMFVDTSSKAQAVSA